MNEDDLFLTEHEMVERTIGGLDALGQPSMLRPGTSGSGNGRGPREITFNEEVIRAMEQGIASATNVGRSVFSNGVPVNGEELSGTLLPSTPTGDIFINNTIYRNRLSPRMCSEEELQRLQAQLLEDMRISETFRQALIADLLKHPLMAGTLSRRADGKERTGAELLDMDVHLARAITRSDLSLEVRVLGMIREAAYSGHYHVQLKVDLGQRYEYDYVMGSLHARGFQVVAGSRWTEEGESGEQLYEYTITW